MFEPFAVGEGLDGHLEAAALEDGGVDPVDDRALELARSTIRRVLADVGSARPMDLSWMITVCLPLHRPKAEPAPMVERRGRSRDARSAGLPLPPGQVRSPNTPRSGSPRSRATRRRWPPGRTRPRPPRSARCPAAWSASSLG